MILVEFTDPSDQRSGARYIPHLEMVLVTAPAKPGDIIVY